MAQRLIAYGDSITAHLNLAETDGWVYKAAKQLGIPYVNRAVSGDMAGDLSTDTIAFQPAASDIVAILPGANDERIYGMSSALRTISADAIRDVIVKANAPQRTLASQMALTGPWLAGDGYLGLYVDGAGASASATVCGPTIWVGVLVSAWSMAHGAATVSIDGVVVDTILGDAGGISLATQDHPTTPWFPITKPYNVAPGRHTVQITTTVPGERFYLEYVASSSQPNGAKVYVSNTIRQNPAGYVTLGGSDQNVLDYGSTYGALVDEFAGRGVCLVDCWGALDPLADMQPDYIHVTALGNTKLANAFASAIAAPIVDAKIQVDALGNFYAVRNDGTARIRLQPAP